MNYYQKFIKRFPTIADLAAADEQEVLRLWQGLGYYSRARNLLMAAKQVQNDFHGVFPNNYEDIRSLKGVGDYTAAAIASFAYDLPYSVLDGNVFRVLSRYFEDATPIDSGLGKKQFKVYAQSLLDTENPAQYNQAIMELGALVCKPKNPNCLACPVQEHCAAFNNGTTENFPKKAKVKKIRTRYFYYLVFPSDELQLIKRTEKDIWKNMYQFPLYEATEKLKTNELKKIVQHGFGVSLTELLFTEKRILTHQHLQVQFWAINDKIENKEVKNIPFSQLDEFPLPRVIDLFVKNHF